MYKKEVLKVVTRIYEDIDSCLKDYRFMGSEKDYDFYDLKYRLNVKADIRPIANIECFDEVTKIIDEENADGYNQYFNNKIYDIWLDYTGLLEKYKISKIEVDFRLLYINIELTPQ